MSSKTLVLIDGHALAYRQFFALERTGMKTSTGHPVWAVYGFFKAIFDLLKKVNPDAIAVSFDTGRQTFRTEAYSEYKANRQSMPDTLRQQMQLIHDGVEALSIPIYKMKGFEADDVIGTIAHRACKLGHKVLILTGDQDSFQLVENHCDIRVLIPSKGELLEYDRDKIFEKMGVWPEQIVDYKGLRGDTSDNIPGVKGIGEKTAVKLLSEFQTMENLLENIEKVASNSVREKLINDREMALKSKFLAKIDQDVPIEFDFEHTHLTMPDLVKLTDFLKEVEFKSYLSNLGYFLKAFNNGETPVIPAELVSYAKKSQEIKKPEQPVQIEHPQQSMQLNLLAGGIQEIKEQPTELVLKCFEDNVCIINTQELFDALIDDLKSSKVFSMDTETTGLDVLNDKLVGISFAWNEQIQTENNKISINNKIKDSTKVAYVPLGHQTGTQLEINSVINSLKPILEDENIHKVLQNAKFEINILKNYDIDLKGIILDTMVASYVKNPTFKHGLKQQAFSHLKINMQEIEELIGKGKTAITMDQVEIEKTAKYAGADAQATLELARYYSNHMDKDEEKILYDIEVPLVSVLADIEWQGVSLDTEYLKSLSKEIQGNLDDVEGQIHRIAGEKFNINSPKQVSTVLFEKLSLPVKAKTQTGFSTNAKVLESLKDVHPIINLLLEQRHLSKLKSTYIDSLPGIINKKDNKIHTNFNQTITSTGRLSSSNPNLQNIPIRTEIGNRIRAAFVPKDKENSVLLSADYSQIELRLLAHYSEDPILIDAYNNNEDIHALTASKVFDVPLEEVTKEMRRKAKAVNFGIIYGQTSFGLSEAIGITPTEAKKFIEKYFKTYPKIKEYMDKTVTSVKLNGYVSTLFGRKRYLKDELESRNRMIREFAYRAAINAPLQGTAADLVKLAMIRLHKELNDANLESKIILQVHDELILEVPKKELIIVKDKVKTCMELDQPLKVPLVIDIEYGPNWMAGSGEEMDGLESLIIE